MSFLWRVLLLDYDLRSQGGWEHFLYPQMQSHKHEFAAMRPDLLNIARLITGNPAMGQSVLIVTG